MKRINPILFLLLSVNCFGQIKYNIQTKKFINWFVKDNLKNTTYKDQLYYNENIDTETIDKIISIVNTNSKDSIYHDTKSRKSTFIFSAIEKELIKQTWLSQKGQAWDGDLVDSVKLFKKKPLVANYSKKDLLEYRKQFEGKYIVTFSAPVFLRNNSICVFFCISGGGGELYIYKNINGQWKKDLNRTIFYN